MKKISGIKFIAFDMDGTLYTSEGILAPAYYRAISQFKDKYGVNMRKPTISELEHQIGQPVRIIFRNLFPEFNDNEKLAELSEMVLQGFIEMIADKGGYIFPEVKETLKLLKDKGFDLAIASNGRYAYLESILNAFDLKDFFLPVVAIDDIKIRKKSDILNSYIKKYKIDKSEMLMVGDRLSDLEASIEIGCHFIGCDYGFAAHEIDSADRVVSSFKEIADYVV